MNSTCAPAFHLPQLALCLVNVVEPGRGAGSETLSLDFCLPAFDGEFEDLVIFAYGTTHTL